MSGDKMPRCEKRVLEALSEQPEDFGFLHFADLKLETGLPIKAIRKACRALAAKGLVLFRGGLWTEDGEMYGSGYGIAPPSSSTKGEG